VNHDTLIEQELQRARIEFSDGFELRTPTSNYWEATLSKASKCRVNLCKLHGSIDWYRYQPDPASPNRQLVGRALNGDFWHTLDFSGSRQWPLSPFSEMLIGSFNKILDYSGGIFADLFHAFRASPRTSDHLIVSGYGFRDKGVNAAIVEWLTSSSTLPHRRSRAPLLLAIPATARAAATPLTDQALL